MSETYLITAKTVEEAIAIANREYADQDHEVTYEILEMPKKGFLGIGAKEAKIKITVTKSVSAELDSLVSDIRGMKVMTTRGGEGKKPQSDKTAHKNGEQKARSGKPQTDKPAQKPQSDKPAQNNQNQKKADKPQTEKAQQKPQQPKADKPQADKAQQKPQQPKADKPQADKAQQKPQQPKADKPQADKAQQKPQQQRSDKPQTEKAQQPVKAEEPAKTPAAEEAKSDIASRLDAAITSATTVDVTPKFGDVKAEYKSSLRNQAKPNKRAPQKASSGSGEQLGGGVTVSAPVGLADFSAEEKTGFGYGESSSGGRISNDIRKNKKKNAPKAESVHTEAPAEEKPAQTEAAPENRTENGESKSRNRRRRDRKKDDRRQNENAEAKAQNREENAQAPAEPAEQKKREPITQAEMDYALEFINTLLKNMGLGASGVPAECPADEEFQPTEEASVYPRINIVGDDTGILIGHHGETLDAIQYLVNLSALRKSKSKDGDYIKIVVDIENYREKREETLRQLARRMAARAVKYRRNVFLEPMNAYERRIIHSELQSFENVSTHSVGADRDRKIIITYEGPDKAPEKPRRRRGDKKPADVEMTAEVAEITYNNPEDYSAEEDNSSEVMDALEQAAVLAADENTTGAGDGDNRRPRKVQKMPIEKFTELLAASETEPDEKPAFED